MRCCLAARVREERSLCCESEAPLSKLKRQLEIGHLASGRRPLLPCRAPAGRRIVAQGKREAGAAGPPSPRAPPWVNVLKKSHSLSPHSQEPRVRMVDCFAQAPLGAKYL